MGMFNGLPTLFIEDSGPWDPGYTSFDICT